MSSLGDVLLALPVVRALHDAWPGARVTVATREEYVQVFSGQPGIEVLPWRREAGLFQSLGRMRRLRPDLVVDLHGTMRSRLICLAAGGRVVRLRKGSLARRILVLLKVRTPGIGRPMVERYLDVVRRLGVDRPAWTGGGWTVLEDESRRAEEALVTAAGGRPLVALAPGAKHFTKQWPPERWSRLVALLGSSVRTVLLGSAGDRVAADRILAARPSGTESPPLNPVGKTDLRTTAAVISRCAVLVTGDSGLLHLADLLCVPAIALFGPTVPEFGFAPSGPYARVLQQRLPCRPCSLHGGARCPIGTHACLEELPPETVAAAVKDAAAVKPAGRALVIQTAYFGDAVLTLPLVRALQGRFGGGAGPSGGGAGPSGDGAGPSGDGVTVLTVPECADLFRGMAGVRVMEYRKRLGPTSGIGEWRRVVREVRAERFDWVFLPHRSFRSGMLAWWSGAPRRVGFRGSAGRWFLTDVADYPAGRHEAERVLGLSRLAGVVPEAVSVYGNVNGVKETASAVLAREGLAGQGSFIGVNPGARWATKRWEADRFAAAADRLASRWGLPVVVFGGEADRAEADRVARAVTSRVVNLAGRTSAGELAALAARARVFISNDTGPMHLAALLGVPVVAVCGPTGPAAGFAPPPDPQFRDRQVVAAHDLPCRPCTRRGGDSCPVGTHDCMRRVTVEDVVEAALRVAERA